MRKNKPYIKIILLSIIILSYANYGFSMHKTLQKDTIVSFLIKNKRFNEANIAIHSKIKIPENLSDKDLTILYHQMTLTKIRIDHPDSALHYSLKGLKHARLANDSSLLAKSLTSLGIAYKNNNQIDSTIAYITQALQIHTKLKNTHGLISCYNTLGVTYNYINKTDLAIEYYTKARKLIQKEGDINNLAINTYNLAIIYPIKKEFDKRITLLLQAADLGQKAKNFNLLIYIYGSISDTYNANGDYGKWEEYFKIANSLSKTFGNKDTYLKGLCNLTDHAIRNNEHDKAIEYANTLLNELDEHNKNSQYDAIKRRISKLLYTTYKSNNEFKLALEHLEEYSSLKENNISTAQIKEIKNIVKQYETETEPGKNSNWFLPILLGIILITFLPIAYKMLFNRKKILSSTTPTNNNTDNKYQQIYNKLIFLLESEHIYKNPNLNQENIISKLNTNKKYLYIALKEYGNTNFKTLINSYRIENAKQIINSKIKLKENIKLSELYAQCGFSTNESFYRIFKKMTNMSPGEYSKNPF